MLQNATALRKSAPWLLTSLMNMSFVLRLPREMHLWRSSSNVPCLPSFLETLKTLTFCSLLTRCTIPCACHAKRALNVQKWSVGVIAISKVVRTWCVLYILTSKCVSRRTTAACTFSTSQLPKVARTCWLQNVLRATTAWNFLISHLARWLRTRRFSEPTFRPSGATNHRKNAVFRDFPTFSRICSCFLLTLSLLWSSLLCSSLLSDSSHLCFSSVHIVGSLTSKLPSMIYCALHDFACSTVSVWIVLPLVFLRVRARGWQSLAGVQASTEPGHIQCYHECLLQRTSGTWAYMAFGLTLFTPAWSCMFSLTI